MSVGVVIDGVKYPSVTVAAKALKVQRITLYRRIWKGTIPRSHLDIKPITVDTVTYTTLKAAAEGLGITYNKAYNLFRRK